MKKQIWLWTVKIAAILLWAFMFFIPDIYEKIENVQLVGHKEIETESTSTFKSIEVEFSENVIYGHVFVSFYDENGKAVYGEVILFKDSNSKFGKVEVENKELERAVSYKIKDFYVKTPTELKIDKLSIILAVVMFFGVLAVIRIDYEEKVIDGKTVGVYSGLIKHRVKIDGEKVFEGKWFTLFKGKEVLLNASESKDVNVLFSAMNKIDFEVIDKPAKEEIKEEVKEEPKTEEKKTQKKKTTSASKAGAKKVVSGASKKAKFQVKSTSKKQSNKSKRKTLVRLFTRVFYLINFLFHLKCLFLLHSLTRVQVKPLVLQVQGFVLQVLERLLQIVFEECLT